MTAALAALGIDAALFTDAHARIRGRIVETPLVRLEPGVVPIGSGVDSRGVATVPSLDDRLDRPLLLKLECLQITGSFKPRGALNKILSLPFDVVRRGIITASGGNHGLAVAFAGRSLDLPTTVYLPGRTSAEKATRIARWGATVLRAGDVWDDAHAAAIVHAEREGLTYIHPFADPAIVGGQGTIAREILACAPETDLLVVAIGGGGLMAGVASAARLENPRIRVIGVEPVGAPTLYESLRAGEVIELPSIATRAGTLAPRKSEASTVAILRETVDEIVLVTDDEMADAARFLLATAGVGVELSGAATVAAILQKKVDLGDARHPCALVCGAGTDAMA